MQAGVGRTGEAALHGGSKEALSWTFSQGHRHRQVLPLVPQDGHWLNRLSKGHGAELSTGVRWGQQVRVRSEKLPSYILHNFWT